MPHWSKLDYEVVASVLSDDTLHLQPAKRLDIAARFADVFERDNGRFDRKKFFEAVETRRHIRASIRESC